MEDRSGTGRGAEANTGPGEVIVRIGGAGACHSDLRVMHDFEPGMMPWKVPFTLGHENAGWVDSVCSTFGLLIEPLPMPDGRHPN